MGNSQIQTPGRVPNEVTKVGDPKVITAPELLVEIEPEMVPAGRLPV